MPDLNSIEIRVNRSKALIKSSNGVESSEKQVSRARPLELNPDLKDPKDIDLEIKIERARHRL